MPKPEDGGHAGSYITVVPWYDRAGFAEICTASTDTGDGCDYDRWRGQATRAIGMLLREGQTIEIVTVHPANYQAWLAVHAQADSQASRQRFVQELAAGWSFCGLVDPAAYRKLRQPVR